jgi:parvulin-like peptidyl-prolyl isomerase
MKKKLFALMIAVVMTVSGSTTLGAKEERKPEEEANKIIVARVNGADITIFMLLRAMNSVASRHRKGSEAATPETTGKIKKEALDRLIFEELAVQEAISQGINPERGDIEKVVEQVKQNLGSEQAYREYLHKAGLTEDAFRKQIERGRRFELITAREVYGKVKVDEELLRDAYEKKKDKFILPDNFIVDDLFFLPKEDEEATRKKADEILKNVKKRDGDLSKLALDGTFIVRKMNIAKEKHPEIYKTMTDMRAGDISGVIKDRDGLHIIKVVRKEPSRQATFEEARNALEPQFLVPAQEKRKETWEQELRKGAGIEIMDDPGLR